MTLTLQHFPAGEHGFYRSPVLLTGEQDALLIDGGFTLEDGRKLARHIQDTGRRLTTIYVSQSDPDYYFSLGPVREAFPEVPVLAAETTLAAIRASVQKKLDTWGPQLKDNGPQTPSDVVFPTVTQEPKLVLEGRAVEIREVPGLPNRRYLWIPSLRAVVGGVLLFSRVHVWVADLATPELRKAWLAHLDELLHLDPEIVVPGHSSGDAPLDRSVITYTRDYLLAFEEELTKTRKSEELIAAMKQRYPQAGMEVALNIGAKVVTGELKWG